MHGFALDNDRRRPPRRCATTTQLPINHYNGRMLRVALSDSEPQYLTSRSVGVIMYIARSAAISFTINLSIIAHVNKL